jgi:hypothetical protein
VETLHDRKKNILPFLFGHHISLFVYNNSLYANFVSYLSISLILKTKSEENKKVWTRVWMTRKNPTFICLF